MVGGGQVQDNSNHEDWPDSAHLACVLLHVFCKICHSTCPDVDVRHRRIADTGGAAPWTPPRKFENEKRLVRALVRAESFATWVIGRHIEFERDQGAPRETKGDRRRRSQGKPGSEGKTGGRA